MFELHCALQNDVCAKFVFTFIWKGKVFSVLVFKLRLRPTSGKLVWKSILVQYATQTSVMWKLSAHRHWEWTFQWRRRHFASSSLTVETKNIYIFIDSAFFSEGEVVDFLWKHRTLTPVSSVELRLFVDPSQLGNTMTKTLHHTTSCFACYCTKDKR